MKRRPAHTRQQPATVPLQAHPLLLAGQVVVALKLVLIILLFVPDLSDAFGIPKSIASHITGGVLAGVLVGLVATYGRAAIPWSPLHIAVGALVASFAIATPLALDPTVAMFGAWRRYLGLTHIIDMAILYLAIVALVRSGRDLARIGLVIVTTAAIVIAYMGLQRAGLDPVGYVGGESARPFGTLGQPEVAAGYVSVLCALTVAVALWPSVPRRVRIGAALFAAVCLGALLVTVVRAGVIALVFGAIALAILLARSPFPERRRNMALIGLAAVIGSIAIAVSPVGARLLILDPSADRSLQSRLEMWETAGKLIASRPLVGVGPDNFSAGYPALRAERSVDLSPAELQTSTHSWPLYVTTSAGFLGLGSFVMMLAVAAQLTWRLARRGRAEALAGVAIAAYLGQSTVSINDVSTDWIPWVALGVLASVGGSAAQPAGLLPRRIAPHVAFVGSAALAVLLGVSIAATSVMRVVGAREFSLSEALVNEKVPQEAIPHAVAAVRADPRRPELWSGLGRALFMGGEPTGASAAFAAAAVRAPWQPVLWRNLALARIAANDPTGARRAVERAVAADHWDPETRSLEATLALERGDWTHAVEAGRLAARLAPSDPSPYETASRALAELGRPGDAGALVREGLVKVSRERSGPLHVLLADIYRVQGRISEALTEVDAALEIKPDDAQALLLKRALLGQ